MSNVLIAGAGPVGLAAAVELARLGHQIRIIDKDAMASQLSRAIGINARTLTLLEPSGVTERLLEKGLKIYHANIYCYGKKRLSANLKILGQRYNFMLALPQDETENILEKRLNELGVWVERNTEFISQQQNGTNITVTIESPQGKLQDTYDYLIGADGAHSPVRKSIHQEFSGFTYDDPWNLADVYMTWPYATNEAYSFIQENGKVLVVIPIGIDRYRIIGTMPDILTALPKGTQIKNIAWQISFKVSCRQVQHYSDRRVFLAGDAAHVHSPVGGRGMNLGIEDACVLAKKITAQRTEDYSAERYKVGRHVVHTTDNLFKLIATKNKFLQVIRDHVIFSLLNIQAIQKRFFKEMLGIE